MTVMPRPFPLEFRRDLVAVARKSEAPLWQIAEDFGISESCLHRWLKLADVDDGVRPGVTTTESAELRELRRRNKTLETENEILRRPAAYFAREISPEMKYSLVRDLAADGIPVAVTCRVLGGRLPISLPWPQLRTRRRRQPVTDEIAGHCEFLRLVRGRSPLRVRHTEFSCPSTGLRLKDAKNHARVLAREMHCQVIPVSHRSSSAPCRDSTSPH
jgi:transposase